jgi:heptosyltransferase II
MTSETASTSRPSLLASIVSDRSEKDVLIDRRDSGNRILLARFHSLGDVILTTGIAQRMIERGDHVDVATQQEFLPVFEGLGVESLLSRAALGLRGGDGRGRAVKYDLVVDLQSNATSRRLLSAMGPNNSARSRAFSRRWVVCWGRRAPRPRVPHVVQRYAEAAGLSEADPARLMPRIVVTERDMDEARAYPRSLDVTSGSCVALAPGASRLMKRWPGDRFLELSERLAARGCPSLRFLDPVGGGYGEGGGEVRASLRPLKAILSRCSLLVTNDSGVMHMGVALGIPVLAIFGSTVAEFGFTPLGSRDRRVEVDLTCRPCAVHGARTCWLRHQRCLKDIAVDDVLEETVALLER